MTKYKNMIAPLVSLFKALGDENRLRAFNSLQDGELCVCQITELLKLAPSTVSKHMSILRQAGLVVSRKEGRWIYYRLADFSVNVPNAEMMDVVQGLLGDDLQGSEDFKTLKRILKCDPEELCKKQCRR